MFAPQDYELLDFGGGRKLERFGGWLVDRPSPPAEHFAKVEPQLWSQAAAKFLRQSGLKGVWKKNREPPADWVMRHAEIAFQLRTTDTGQVGAFPEQAENWVWIFDRVARSRRPLKVLNLFAYTGGSTLAAAAAGAEVTHIDAARNAVQWARRNAEASGLGEAPIRWIAEDAAKFVDHERRRGKQYDALVLDPPSYGHGPKGESWKIERDLGDLLRGCAELTRGRLAWMLLTCHSPGLGPAELESMVAEIFFGHCGSGAEARMLHLETPEGRQLPAGVAVRWPRSSGIL